jgi:hypothetical protein
MQSVASLMSMGKVDIGNLEDLDEDEEDEDHAGAAGNSSRISAEISSIANQVQQLDAHCGNPFQDDDDDLEPPDALNPFGDVLFRFFLVFFFFSFCLIFSTLKHGPKMCFKFAMLSSCLESIAICTSGFFHSTQTVVH